MSRKHSDEYLGSLVSVEHGGKTLGQVRAEILGVNLEGANNALRAAIWFSEENEEAGATLAKMRRETGVAVVAMGVMHGSGGGADLNYLLAPGSTPGAAARVRAWLDEPVEDEENGP